jgi:hypothetical protein
MKKVACKNEAFCQKQRISVVGLGTGPQCMFVMVRMYNQSAHNALKGVFLVGNPGNSTAV